MNLSYVYELQLEAWTVNLTGINQPITCHWPTGTIISSFFYFVNLIFWRSMAVSLLFLWQMAEICITLLPYVSLYRGQVRKFHNYLMQWPTLQNRQVFEIKLEYSYFNFNRRNWEAALKIYRTKWWNPPKCFNLLSLQEKEKVKELCYSLKAFGTCR